MNQDWFEMLDVRRKSFNKSVWIPLRSAVCSSNGEYGYKGYKEDFFGSGSLAIPTDNIEAAKKLGWLDVGTNYPHSGRVQDGVYISAEVYRGKFEGVYLVLEQMSDDEKPHVWHLNQDLVITLGLRREENTWVCPKDGYTKVARLEVSENNEPILMEIKSQYLKDYLCARKMALYMTHYFSRVFVCDDASHINWPEGNSRENNESDRWEGRLMPIHEGGNPFGEKMAVFHATRTDVDESDDVPDISGIPTDKNIHGESWEKEFEGRKLYRVSGELWRNEIIRPGKTSPKVRGDEIQSTVSFVIDAEGKKCCGRDLINAGKWLWFNPEVIMALCHRKGGQLAFGTAQTGKVSRICGYSVSFGVNELGLINVYAKDVGLLPEWQQQIWAGYNVTPEGGVSKELLAFQAKGELVDTKAPEKFLSKGIKFVNELSQAKLSIQIFSDHAIIPGLLKSVHRFRAIDEASLFALAKDLARIIVESLDAKAMQSIVSPSKSEKGGSLKSLENLLASKFDRGLVRKMTASLVGVYELRNADAHLPGSKAKKEAFQLIKIDQSLPFVHQGHRMLCQVVLSIYGIADLLKKW